MHIHEPICPEGFKMQALKIYPQSQNKQPQAGKC